MQVGTVDPIGDYKKLIDRKDVDNFEEGDIQHRLTDRFISMDYYFFRI